jgi:DedD protein
MARTVSDEELQLKRRARRRLIGAIVLVTAVVVFLPMVLDPEPKSERLELAVQIPSPDSTPFEPKVPPPSAPPAEPPRAEPKAKAPQAAASEPRQPRPAAKAAAKSEPASPKPKAPAADEPFVVQVIALADADKAQGIQRKIAAAGIPSYTEVVKTAKGDVTRVRAGPYATREQAEKAQAQLKRLGLNGTITTR